MSIINENENEEDYLQIKLKSDAFEDGIPTIYKQNPNNFYEEIASIHKLLFRLDKNKPLSISITYKIIDDDNYITEILDLFKEWFPFSYDRDYFRKYFIRQSCIAVGAFIKINFRDYLVGCALGEIISDDKFKKILPDVLIEKSWFFLSESDPVDCGVLQSLGVIDEYRRLGVGTRLTEIFIEEVKKRDGVAIYLSTLAYNNSAIKFFENNQWHFYNTMEQYYRMNEKNYDAIIYYYIIDIKKCKKAKNNKRPVSNDTNKFNGGSERPEDGVSEISEHKEKGCLASILGFFSSNKE